ncbi:MAG: hypothetical protein HY000_21235 [Planctomycetes bacterium]|nr:hypothetical protein [Planctomycetota bacterium]
MPLTAVALLSGGLDSMLAVRILQEQGTHVEAINFHTLFTCCQNQAALAADELGVRLTVISQQDDYLELIRRPKHGYGRGANPCVDCRVYMFQLARRFMTEVGAELVISGEVLGQRPMSQKRRQLATIAREAGLDDCLLRPLSAKLLPPTAAEVRGLIDRDRLYSFSGRSRKGLIELARQFGFRRVPSPSTGCALTEPDFARKVHDLVQLDPGGGRWDFELLKVGRHVRLGPGTKVVLGRRAEENRWLESHFAQATSRAAALLTPADFTGPACLIIGQADDQAIDTAGGLLLRYAKHGSEGAQARLKTSTGERLVAIGQSAEAENAVPL